MRLTLLHIPRPSRHPRLREQIAQLQAEMADWERAFAILGSASQLQREPHLQLVPPLASRSAS